MISKLRTASFAALFLLPFAASGQEGDSWWSELAQQQVDKSDDNQSELVVALNTVKVEHRRGLEFLIENMPEADLQTLSATFLLDNVERSYQAMESAPWADKIPEQVFLNDVLPYANVDEKREAWRADMWKRCSEMVKDCKTPTEAAIKLNRELFPAIKVRYGTSRRRANQSPSESIEQSVASCTGLSILLVDACRSVGVPARIVGVPSWTNKRGNHTWVEIWDGQWHFTGAAEPSNAGLNHAWFTHDASQADGSKRMNRIYAASFQKTDTVFPLVWNPACDFVYAVDVTDRYTQDRKATPEGRSRVLIRVIDKESKTRIVTDVRVANVEGEKASLHGKSKGTTADTNDFLTFELSRESKYHIEVRLNDAVSVFEKTVSDEDQQLWEFEIEVNQ